MLECIYGNLEDLEMNGKDPRISEILHMLGQ